MSRCTMGRAERHKLVCLLRVSSEDIDNAAATLAKINPSLQDLSDGEDDLQSALSRIKQVIDKWPWEFV